MRKSNVILVALGFSISSAAIAQQRLPSDVYEVYMADKERIEREYKADKQRCDSFERIFLQADHLYQCGAE